jgi:hypothetical protein
MPAFNFLDGLQEATTTSQLVFRLPAPAPASLDPGLRDSDEITLAVSSTGVQTSRSLGTGIYSYVAWGLPGVLASCAMPATKKSEAFVASSAKPMPRAAVMSDAVRMRAQSHWRRWRSADSLASRNAKSL